MIRKILFRMLLWAACIHLTLPQDAFAYLDPGTGSMILQAIAATLVTCLVFMQDLRNKIRSFFSQSKTKKSTQEANAPVDIDQNKK